MKVDRLALGCKPLDDLLGGGIEYASLTNVYGPPGSGKTNVCIQAAVRCVEKGKKVVFIDTEGGFSIERFAQMSKNPKDANKIILLEPKDFKEQSESIKKLERLLEKEDIGLILVDSLVNLYRLELDENGHQKANRSLAFQLSLLSKLCREKNVPVLITNQVYSDFENKEIELSGRDVPKYWSKCLVELKKIEKGRRLAILRKHRSLPEGRETEFQITEKGLKESKGFKLF